MGRGKRDQSERVQLTLRMPGSLRKRAEKVREMLRREGTDIGLLGRHSLNDTLNLALIRGLDVLEREYASKTSALETQTLDRLKARAKGLKKRCLGVEAENKALSSELEESEARCKELEAELAQERARRVGLEEELDQLSAALRRAEDGLAVHQAHCGLSVVVVVDGVGGPQVARVAVGDVTWKGKEVGFVGQDGYWRRIYTSARKAYKALDLGEPSLSRKMLKAVLDPRPPLLPPRL